MNRRVSAGSQLARQCWDLLRQNREWLKIPLLSAVGVTIVTVVFGILSAVVYAVLGNRASSTMNAVGIIGLFLYYFATYTIVIYSETALVSVVMMKIQGKKDNPVAADGFAVANQRIPAIIGFAA